MAIDITNERLLPVAKAHNHVPTNPHPGTIFRWWRFGVRGVKLETAKIGAKRFTSEEALERFVARLTAASDGELAPQRTPRQRAKQIAAADRRTALAGI